MKKLITVLFLALLIPRSEGQNFTWAKQLEGSASEAINVITDESGNAYISGQFQGTVDFDPGPAVLNITAGSSRAFFIQKLGPGGNLLWAKTIDGSCLTTGFYAPSTHIKLDAFNNVYITDQFCGTVDFDPGPGTATLSSVGTRDLFILKLDSFGNFIWVKRIGSPGAGIGSSGIAVDSLGNTYTTGPFGGTSGATVDFNPGAGVYNLTASSYNAVFILKLDPSGNFIWAKGLTGSGASVSNPFTLTLDDSLNIYTVGSLTGTIDLNPGTGVYNISSPGSLSSLFISKLNSSGNFVWAKSVVINNTLAIQSIATDNASHITMTGYFTQTVDFDPGPGVYNLTSGTSSSSYNLVLWQLDTQGNFIWANRIPSTSSTIGYQVATDSLNNIYVTGVFSGTADFDPGIGSTALISAGSSGTWDVAIAKYNSSGNLIWAKGVGGSNSEQSFSTTVGAAGDVFIAGYFTSPTIDFDPGPGIYNLTNIGSSVSAFICKWSQDSCSNLTIVIDSIHNVSCVSPGYSSVTASGGLAPYTYMWNTSPPTNDSVANFTGNGIYQIVVTDSNSCSVDRSYLINGPQYSSFDLTGSLWAGGFRGGHNSGLNLLLYNDGCVPVSGSVKLILDPLVSYVSSYITPVTISGDTLIWNFSNLQYDSVFFQTGIQVFTSLSAVIGDSLCFKIIIDPVTGDADTTNNVKYYCYEYQNSYDPNIKSVYPTGACIPNYVENDQLLTYTIQFQNTGTADAIDIYVLDTLDAGLDLSTVRVTGNSDPVITEVLPGNVLKFRFDNIHLPDSTSNEPASHGYVIYEIMPLPGLTNGTEIKNKAGIYFDFNPPVYTNSVLNTIIDVVPTTCSSVDVPAVKSITSLLVYPNPANSTITVKSDKPTEVRIMNMLGEVLMSRAIGKEAVIDISQLANGIYFIQTTQGTMQKLVRQ